MSSIFEYGSHLPLLKLSGYTLCIELMIKKYLVSIENDVRYTNLLLFLFDILTDTKTVKEIGFDHLLTMIDDKIPEIGGDVSNYVYDQLSLIVNRENNADLFDYFEKNLKLSQHKQMSKSSFLGIFHRKFMVCYNHSSFATLNKLLLNIVAYYKNGNGNNYNVLNSLHCPYDLDFMFYNSSKSDTGIDIAMAPMIISQAFCDLPSIHYKNMKSYLSRNEYISSLSHLHKYFDFVASSFKVNWNSLVNDAKNESQSQSQSQYQLLLLAKRKKMQYSLLCRSQYYAYFGHYNLAIQQIIEALQRAQNIGDRTCVASTLYLLIEFLSNQSPNINLIKQIYENCIQNCNAIPAVHIASLLGLTKWNLYHIHSLFSKSRPAHLWQYLYFANKVSQSHMECAHGNDNMSAIAGNAWRLYGNEALSVIQFEISLLNHYKLNHLYLNHLNTNTTTNNNKHRITLLILTLKESLKGQKLRLASIYQTRLSEIVTRKNVFFYLEMMYLHSQIRFEYGQYMEASRIINNLISFCNRRSLQCLTIDYYLFLAKIHLKSHSQTTLVQSYVLRAWSIVQSYHFYYWLPKCAISLAQVHLRLNNVNKSIRLIQEYLPIILKKNNHLIVMAYINLAKCCTQNKQFINAIQYFHTARIWCVKLIQTQELLEEIYYFLARLYQSIGDTLNRDKSAQKMFEMHDNRDSTTLISI